MFRKVITVIGIMLAIALPVYANASTPQLTFAKAADQVKGGVTQVGGNEEGNNDLLGTVRSVINTILFIVGILSVVVIIVAGIFYVTSTGDSGRIKRGKDTLMYAVVGLVVAILAYAIVNFVIDRLS